MRQRGGNEKKSPSKKQKRVRHLRYHYLRMILLYFFGLSSNSVGCFLGRWQTQVIQEMPRRFMVFSWERISRPSSRLLPTAFSMSSFLAFAEFLDPNTSTWSTSVFVFPNQGLTTLSWIIHVYNVIHADCFTSGKPTAIHHPTACNSSILPVSSSNCARSSAWKHCENTSKMRSINLSFF